MNYTNSINLFYEKRGFCMPICNKKNYFHSRNVSPVPNAYFFTQCRNSLFLAACWFFSLSVTSFSPSHFSWSITASISRRECRNVFYTLCKKMYTFRAGLFPCIISIFKVLPSSLAINYKNSSSCSNFCFFRQLLIVKMKKPTGKLNENHSNRTQ